MAGGVARLIVGTVTVGALGATALPGFQPGAGGQDVAGQRAPGPDADIGMMDTANAAAAQALAAQDAVEADSDLGMMDASGRPATEGAPATYVPPERPGPTPR